MIIKRKQFSFMSWLTGDNTTTKKSSDEIRAEFKKQTLINPDAVREIKEILPTNLSIPRELQLYLSFIYENYHDTSVTLFTKKSNKSNKVMLGWKDIIKNTKRFRKIFGPNTEKTLIFLTLESPTMKNFYGDVQDYFCYFPKADGIWLFQVQWGNGAQGLFGISAKDARLLSTLDLMLM